MTGKSEHSRRSPAASEPASNADTGGSHRPWLRPRLRAETGLLAVSLVVTLAAKALVAWTSHHSCVTVACLGLSDLAFFAGVYLLLVGLRWLRPGRIASSGSVLVSLAILAWSAANAAWLEATGVQLHTGVIAALAPQPAQWRPVIGSHLACRAAGASLAGLGCAILALWTAWRVMHPPKSSLANDHRCAAVAVCLFIAISVLHLWLPPSATGSDQVLNYSSHLHALESLISPGVSASAAPRQARIIPHVGQMSVGSPPDGFAQPNIVLVMLESVSYPASGLAEDGVGPMPTLKRLAAEGAEFTNTRVPVPQTGKAFWTTLSGTTPDVQCDFSEAVLTDEPYEGLPTLLARLRYRTGFFQMACAMFGCAPGVFANFGFDYAWFRENLEDRSARVGFLGGDDFRMLEPALRWAAQEPDRPFFLTLMNSVGHDPFEVPAWFGSPKPAGPEARLQALEYTDAFLAELCRNLEQFASQRELLLCVIGDHGDSPRASGRCLRWVPYEDVLRIPWVIRWPGHVPAGQRCDWPCSQLDLTPTILTLLGYDLPEATFEGRNALQPSPPDRRLFFSAWYEDSPMGLVEGSQKWLYWPATGEVLLYDLARDPGELSPLPASQADRTRTIAAVHDWRESTRLSFDPRRFRTRVVFDHWRVFSTGRCSRACYLP